MSKLGFTHRQAGHLYFGRWVNLYEAYKKQYNFEIRRAAYRLDEMDEPVSSLSVL